VRHGCWARVNELEARLREAEAHWQKDVDDYRTALKKAEALHDLDHKLANKWQDENEELRADLNAALAREEGWRKIAKGMKAENKQLRERLREGRIGLSVDWPDQ
jgi:predicted  nucleic acid-binding Zn-ribbon protein